ncbi:MAG TPA: cytochrome d ubiquinol oxidase subunit II, partial [Tenuifilaceae bacterium]|nr:cytochrome d ubiquinol oxidase subunit II [Tenuifilaceae bacterium]
WHGLEAALNLHNLALGLTVFFLARTLAILYFMNHVNHNAIFERAKKHLLYNALPFVVLFLVFTIWLMLRDGFAVNPADGTVFMAKYKYLHNFIQMPVVLIVFLVGVLLVLWGIAKSLISNYTKGIWFTGAGTVLAVLALLLIAGWNNTAYYPSTFNLQHSLTIFNSSSSKFTLTVMSFVSLLIPFVVAYIWYAWKSINVKQIDEEEMKSESHVY